MAEKNSTTDSFIPALYRPPSLLPIAQHEQSLLYAVETFGVVIVVGQTGSGKTTQIPQFLERAGWANNEQLIAVTQPRRVAATSVAGRVAEELGCVLGSRVGYSIRFDDVTSSETRIKFVTDGMLLREALADPLLSRYTVIMVDEAHERSISTDILLGILKKIRKLRPELRIIVSSATLQAEAFLDFFAPSPADQGTILTLPGRMYPVDVHYLETAAEDYIQQAVDTALAICQSEPEGDILVFLTGREEIDKCLEMLAYKSDILALPLYAGLSSEQQMQVFEPAPENHRKIVVSTNIAEASITLDGLVYVIDCGFVKLRAYDPSSGIERLTATPISKASAVQRAGRAGRVRNGKCYRLYSKSDFDCLPDATSPEIQRSNLAPVLLQMKALGIDNILRFDFFTPPPALLIGRALELLFTLGALDDYAKLTRPLGIRMAELAVEPMMAKVLLSAPAFGCLSEVLSIAAMTSLQGAVWYQAHGDKRAAESARRKFAAEEGDHVTLLNVYQAFVTRGKKEARWCRDHFLNHKAMLRAVSVRGQLKRYLERFGIEVGENLSKDQGSSAEQIVKCLTQGYFSHVARMKPDGTFALVNNSLVLHAHPSSLMFNRKADWVIFQEIMETSDKTFIREVSKIEKSWLTEGDLEKYYHVANGA